LFKKLHITLDSEYGLAVMTFIIDSLRMFHLEVHAVSTWHIFTDLLLSCQHIKNESLMLG